MSTKSQKKYSWKTFSCFELIKYKKILICTLRNNKKKTNWLKQIVIVILTVLRKINVGTYI